MNRTEQIVMRIWNYDDNATCYRTKKNVLAQNGFSILLLNNLDKINPLWTYNRLSGYEGEAYNKCTDLIEKCDLSYSVSVNLPSCSDMRADLKGKDRSIIIPFDLTELQLDTTGKYKGCLTVNLWYLYDLVWALGDNVQGFWSGTILHRKQGGIHKTAAQGGLYLKGDNGRAALAPIEKKVR